MKPLKIPDNIKFIKPPFGNRMYRRSIETGDIELAHEAVWNNKKRIYVLEVQPGFQYTYGLNEVNARFRFGFEV